MQDHLTGSFEDEAMPGDHIPLDIMHEMMDKSNTSNTANKNKKNKSNAGNRANKYKKKLSHENVIEYQPRAKRFKPEMEHADVWTMQKAVQEWNKMESSADPVLTMSSLFFNTV